MDEHNSLEGCIKTLYLLSRLQYRSIQKRKSDRPSTNSHQEKKQGFTIVELMVVVLIIGIVAGVAVPGWLAFLNSQRLRTSTDRVYSAMRSAQSHAKFNKTTWQVSFREEDEAAQWATHPKDTVPEDAQWNNLDSGIEIDAPETTLYQNSSTGIWRMQFNYKGHANGRLGRITLSSRSGGKAKRCVFVSTLLGEMRKAKENPTPKNGRYCY